MRVTRSYDDQLTDGIFHLMAHLGIWSGPVAPLREPVISRRPDDVAFLNAPVSGIFLKETEHGAHLRRGEIIGLIVNPLTGEVLETVCAPCDGWLFTVREYPVVGQGSLMARILREGGGGHAM